MTDTTDAFGHFARPVVSAPIRVTVYAAVPLSFIYFRWYPLASILASIYIVSLFGIFRVVRRGRFPTLLGSFFFLWYFALLGIELLNGNLFDYPLRYEASFFESYLILIAFPFWVVGLRASRPNLDVLDTVSLVAVPSAAGLSLYQYLVLDVPRPEGLSGNPILFGMIALIWSLWLFARSLRTSVIEWKRLAAALTGLIPIALSGSKLVWLCAILGYFALLLAWVPAGRRWRVGAMIAAMATPVGWLLYQADFVRSRFADLGPDLERFLVAGDTSGASVGLRFGAASSGLLAFLDRPWLGYGLSRVKLAAEEHRPSGVADFSFLYHLHNEYITFMVAFGVLGLVFLLLLLAVFFWAASRCGDPVLKRFGLVIGAVLVVYMSAEVAFPHPNLIGLAFFFLGILMLSARTNGTFSLPGSTRGWMITFADVTRSHRVAGGLPMLVVLVATAVLGTVGFAWSQRDAVFPVAQAATLLETPVQGSRLRLAEASVIWTLEDDADLANSIIVAELDAPRRGLELTIRIRRNQDPALPASHVITVTADAPPSLPSRLVADIGMLAFKRWPGAPGENLVGAVAKIEDGAFLIGLSQDPSDMAVNARLMRTGGFLELPLVFRSGQRAILLFEKGSMGDQAFKRALDGWRGQVNLEGTAH